MPIDKKSLGSGLLGEIDTEKWLIFVGFAVAWLIPAVVLDGSSRPTALGLPVWFLWVLGFVVVEYALLYRLGSHYLSEPDVTSGPGGE